MKIPFLRKLLLSITAVLIAAGCSSTPPPPESGFLGDYSRLHKQDAPGGGTRLAYINPDFTPAHYHALWVDPIVFYPEPKPNKNVSQATLDQIRDYMNQSLRAQLGNKVQLIDRAGPGVAHVRIAITAVGTETEALAPYQYIPIALVITGATAAIEGGRPKEATLAVETQVADSMTGQLLYAAVRGGTGERIRNAAQGEGEVQLQNLKPLVDTWMKAVADQVGTYVRMYQ